MRKITTNILFPIFVLIAFGQTFLAQESEPEITAARLAARKELGQLGVAYSKDSFIKQAAEGDTIAVRLFLAAGIDPDVKASDQSNSALTAAISNRQSETARLLIAKGANVNETDGQRNTPLILAAQVNQVDIIKALLNKKADLKLWNNVGRSALFAAAENGSDESFRLLLARGANPNDKLGSTGYTILMEASASLLIDTVKMLIDKGQDVNATTNEGWTALMSAASHDRTDTIKLLLERGSNVNAQSNADYSSIAGTSFSGSNITALMLAAVDGSPDTINALINKGARVNDVGSLTVDNIHLLGPPLWQAARHRKTDNVKALIERKADVNYTDKNGIVALIISLGANNLPVIETLLANGANPNAPGYQGNTPLLQAIGVGSPDIIKALIRSGANLDAENSRGETALKRAHNNNRADLVKILLDAGAKN